MDRALIRSNKTQKVCSLYLHMSWQETKINSRCVSILNSDLLSRTRTKNLFLTKTQNIAQFNEIISKEDFFSPAHLHCILQDSCLP